MKHFTVILLSLNFIFSLTDAYCQLNYQTKFYNFTLGSEVNVSQIPSDDYFQMSVIEAPVPGGIQKTELEKIKQSIPPKLYQSAIERGTSALEKPILYYNYEGNRHQGHVPNDNHLAVSNEGKIISVTNSIIYFYQNDSQIHAPITLDTFGAGIYLPHGKYDPRVIYDLNKDRFIIVFLNGFTDITSNVYIAFSKSNDPLGDWNLYTIPGNPLNDSSWTDFPMIALSSEELFLTVNLLKNMGPGDTWKTTFKQTIIWQIKLKDGYDGNNLSTKMYDNIEYQGKRLRNICPVPQALENPDDKMYFLSNNNFSIQTDSFYLLEVNGKADNPNTKLSLKFLKSNIKYGVAPSADMPFNRLLETNDARILDAYLLNNNIHFVGNSINSNSNKASFYHGMVNKLSSNPEITLKIIDHAYLEFGFPNIEYTGNGTTDEAMILVNHSSDTVNPGVSAFFYKNNEWSEPKTIKKGETTVTVQTGKTQRWGDYTGFQRKYNENGIVWGSGYYGRYVSPTQRFNGTWICQLKSPTYSGNNDYFTKQSNTNIFPNPATENVTTEFYNHSLQDLKISLKAVDGKILKVFRNGPVKPGLNRVTFSIAELKPGIYYLTIENGKDYNQQYPIIKK